MRGVARVWQWWPTTQQSNFAYAVNQKWWRQTSSYCKKATTKMSVLLMLYCKEWVYALLRGCEQGWGTVARVWHGEPRNNQTLYAVKRKGDDNKHNLDVALQEKQRHNILDVARSSRIARELMTTISQPLWDARTQPSNNTHAVGCKNDRNKRCWLRG